MTAPSSRHGVRADNKTQTSISLRLDLLRAAQDAASTEGRTFSNWLEQLLKDKFPGAATATPAKPKTKAKAKPAAAKPAAKPAAPKTKSKPKPKGRR